MKVYSGAPAAARCYVEADRGRVDDYYLAEGTGVARRFTATEGHVTELAPLTGDIYETWVAGRDPDTGEPRGRLRTDAHAVRFVEVVVNGPKTWSIAAALHPDIAAAYEAAQDRAAEQIISWLSEHATTRVGPAGGQLQVPVQVLEAATVRHYTSRANDPHWHLHLQINARVFAAGKWRGLHTVGVRDFLGALNGIGHAAMGTDPELNAALAAHGYTKGTTGEILELAGHVGPFSARHAQIARNADRHEREWTQAHPGEHPGPALRRCWDARAWAEDRPDKITAHSGADLCERWRAELHDLGFRAPPGPVPMTSTPAAALDREELVDRALIRLAAARSAWNAADVRGEVERLIAAADVVTGPAVRLELAEDLAARALRECVPLLRPDGVPEHIRVWTSAPVLAVEAELTARFAARAGEPAARLADADLAPPADQTPGPADLTPGPADLTPGPADLTPGPADLTPPAGAWVTAGGLDPEQAAAVTALAGGRPLIVIEGAAGAGKTTTLAAAKTLLEGRGRRLVVLTPTLKAAKAAADEVGTAAGSAARLAFEHGWRWDNDGRWTRLAVDGIDSATGRTYTGPAEAARLRPGDLLVVDEAGMLNQDTARALLTVADECGVRLALLGDRHQLPAVGRGGVLDLAVGQVDADAYLTPQGLHRFTRTNPDGRTVPDTDYGDLTLSMRAGDDPGKVFDALLARGQVRLHPDPAALREALAAAAAASYANCEPIAVVADTREQVAELNTAIRERLVTDRWVDDVHATVTGPGEWVGVGDRVVTRRNDRDLAVANRDTWIVTAVGRNGGLLVTPADMVRGNVHGAVAGNVPRHVTPVGRGPRVLPADYVTAHVELAYATTAHGAQGDTVSAGHLVVGEHTGAASAYVGMTRGRENNTAHLVADDAAEAREQWIQVFARDRADLGPAHAAEQAAGEAARYAAPRPLEQVLAELREARWAEQRCLRGLAALEPQRDALAALVADGPHPGQRLEVLQAAQRETFRDAEEARRRAEASGAAVTADADRIRNGLVAAWHAERGGAADAARVLWGGPGRFGLHRGAYSRAAGELTAWAQAWRPVLPAMPTGPQLIAEIAGRSDYPLRTGESLAAAARAQAEAAHSEHAALVAAAATAGTAADRAWSTLADAQREDADRAARFGRLADLPDPTERLADAERDLAAARTELAAAQARIATLTAEPAYRHQQADQLSVLNSGDEPAGRRTRGTLGRPARALPAKKPPAPERVRVIGHPRPEDLHYLQHRPGPGRGIGR